MIVHENINDALIPIRKSREGECITIFFTPFKTGEVRNFRCLNCGKLMFQYESDVALIVDSADSPKEKGPIDYQCSRCKLMYRLLW